MLEDQLNIIIVQIPCVKVKNLNTKIVQSTYFSPEPVVLKNVKSLAFLRLDSDPGRIDPTISGLNYKRPDLLYPC
jgi:hypothetical protein